MGAGLISWLIRLHPPHPEDSSEGHSSFDVILGEKEMASARMLCRTRRLGLGLAVVASEEP